jgi:hypothetical protein
MSAPTAAEPEALPENGEHKLYSVPSYPGYEGICECRHAFGPVPAREDLHRAYRVHFRLATRAT